jgi:Phage tail tube protein, TTP
VEAVLTSTAHGYSNGDILEVTSNWGRLDGRFVRIKSVTTDTFTLEGIDTSNTTYFPPGSGVGSVRKVTGWQQVVQVLGLTSSGGEPKQVEYSYFDSDVSYTLNDGFSGTSMTLELDADSISTAGYALLRTLTEVQTNNCLRINARNGSVTYQPTTVALNEVVQMQAGQVNRVRCAFNGRNRAVRYAS